MNFEFDFCNFDQMYAFMKVSYIFESCACDLFIYFFTFMSSISFSHFKVTHKTSFLEEK